MNYSKEIDYIFLIFFFKKIVTRKIPTSYGNKRWKKSSQRGSWKRTIVEGQKDNIGRPKIYFNFKTLDLGKTYKERHTCKEENTYNNYKHYNNNYYFYPKYLG